MINQETLEQEIEEKILEEINEAIQKGEIERLDELFSDYKTKGYPEETLLKFLDGFSVSKVSKTTIDPANVYLADFTLDYDALAE